MPERVMKPGWWVEHWVAVAAFILAATVFVALLRAFGQQAAEQQGYRSDQALACFILPALDRQEKTLPTLAYYGEHPKELINQLVYIREVRDQALAAWGKCENPPPVPRGS